MFVIIDSLHLLLKACSPSVTIITSFLSHTPLTRPCNYIFYLYFNFPVLSTRNLLELINALCKVAEHKIDTKSVAFLYANNKQTEIEI